MGYTKWSTDAYHRLAGSRAGASRDDLFRNNRRGQACPKMLPHGLKFRESRDSEIHPDSLSIGVFLDVTGSMGCIPEILVRHKLGALMNTLIDYGVPHPQILFGAIGDHHCDRFPLQVGQFESGTGELDLWLTSLYLEGGGGGQIMESYPLAWLIGGRHTAIDCFEKRGQKGFLFTIGDEAGWDRYEPCDLRELMGSRTHERLTDRQLLAEAQRLYHVFHIHINQGNYPNHPEVLRYWRNLLGERLIVLDNYEAVAETMAATVATMQGAELNRLLASFNNDTAQAVLQAVGPTRPLLPPSGFIGLS